MFLQLLDPLGIPSCPHLKEWPRQGGRELILLPRTLQRCEEPLVKLSRDLFLVTLRKDSEDTSLGKVLKPRLADSEGCIVGPRYSAFVFSLITTYIYTHTHTHTHTYTQAQNSSLPPLGAAAAKGRQGRPVSPPVWDPHTHACPPGTPRKAGNYAFCTGLARLLCSCLCLSPPEAIRVFSAVFLRKIPRCVPVIYLLVLHTFVVSGGRWCTEVMSLA